MEKSLTLDSRSIAALTAQLAKLNKLLSDEIPDTPGVKLDNRSYLFELDMNSPGSLNEYKEYFAFLDIVSQVLNDYGIRISNNGYAYIMDAVKIIIDRDSFDLRLNNDIYPLIARKHHLRSYSSIEHCIRNSLGTAYEEYLRDPGSNKMGVFAKKPTTKQFLFYTADLVMRLMRESLMETAC